MRTRYGKANTTSFGTRLRRSRCSVSVSAGLPIAGNAAVVVEAVRAVEELQLLVSFPEQDPSHPRVRQEEPGLTPNDTHQPYRSQKNCTQAQRLMLPGHPHEHARPPKLTD